MSHEIRQMVKAECSNWTDGSCLNVVIRDDLTLGLGKFATKDGGCCLPNSRCAFFEECVMPLADTTADEYKSKVYRQAAFACKMKFPEYGSRSARKCPDCKTTPLMAKERYCPKCAKARRKETFRKSQAGCRGNKSDVMSTVTHKSDQCLQGSAEA